MKYKESTKMIYKWILRIWEGKETLWTVEQCEGKNMATIESLNQKISRAARDKETEVLGAECTHSSKWWPVYGTEAHHLHLHPADLAWIGSLPGKPLASVL